MFLLRMRGSRNFCQGGPGLSARKQPGQHFVVLSLFYSFRGGKMVLLQNKLYFLKDLEGGQHFPRGGGSNFFQWGCPNANFYRNLYNLWFSRGVGVGLDPLSPSGSAHDKLSVYKCTNSKRSTKKLKPVLHKILNVKIKVWKSHVDLDVGFTFVIYREE